MRAVRLAAESLTVSARCTAPAPGTLDWPITLSRSRSVRPVPAVTVLLHEQIATVMQPSANMRGSDMSHSGESIVGKWYGNSSGISSRQYVASFLKDLDRWTDFHRIIVSSPQLVPRGNISGFDRELPPVASIAIPGPTSMATILCIDDESSLGAVLEHTVAKIGHRPLIASTADAALDTIAGTSVDLIVTDYGMSRLNGIDLLQWLEKGGYRVPVITMTDSANIHSAVDAMNAGAIGYLATPVREETIEIAVGQALEVSERTLRNKLNAPKVVARGT
jgi:CheY-like chemotaxis protein